MSFTKRKIDQFVSDGFVILREGFSPEIAAEGACVDFGIVLALPGTAALLRDSRWFHLKRGFRDGPFSRVMNPRLQAAFDRLIGEGRWLFDGRFGWWPVLFPGFPGPARAFAHDC